MIEDSFNNNEKLKSFNKWDLNNINRLQSLSFFINFNRIVRVRIKKILTYNLSTFNVEE